MNNHHWRHLVDHISPLPSIYALLNQHFIFATIIANFFSSSPDSPITITWWSSSFSSSPPPQKLSAWTTQASVTDCSRSIRSNQTIRLLVNDVRTHQLLINKWQHRACVLRGKAVNRIKMSDKVPHPNSIFLSLFSLLQLHFFLFSLSLVRTLSFSHSIAISLSLSLSIFRSFLLRCLSVLSCIFPYLFFIHNLKPSSDLWQWSTVILNVGLRRY